MCTIANAPQYNQSKEFTALKWPPQYNDNLIAALKWPPQYNNNIIAAIKWPPQYNNNLIAALKWPPQYNDNLITLASSVLWYYRLIASILWHP